MGETTDQVVIDQYHALLDWLAENAPLAYSVSDKTPVGIVTAMLDVVRHERPHTFWRATCVAAGIELKAERRSQGLEVTHG